MSNLSVSRYDIVIIGGGPAGIAAALGAAQQAGKKGISSILIVDRDANPGGILNQCIHDGFGLHRYNEILTGPEYADREFHRLKPYIEEGLVALSGGTFVQAVEKQNDEFRLFLMAYGACREIIGKAVIFAMGCRERTAGAISLPGSRPAGVFTAGTAQRLMNIQNITVGSRAVIIGSGDIGLIMARRLTLEGAEVAAVTEIMPFPGGLDRNIRQCLNDFNIPLYLSTAILQVHGKNRVEGVTVAPLLPDGTPDFEKKEFIACDTVLLSVGLIPEHELIRTAGAEIDAVTQGPTVDQTLMTSVPGLFASGNVLQVHDLVDFVSDEAGLAGKSAAVFVSDYTGNTARQKDSSLTIQCNDMIRYILPQRISAPGNTTLSLRVTKPGINVRITVQNSSGERLFTRKFTRVSPSEMIRIPVQIDRLESLEVIGESL